MNSNNLTKSALHIASQNINLREFTIRDVPVWDHLDQLSGVFRTKHLGHYTVQHEHGERILSVQEVGVGALRQLYHRSFSRLIEDTQHL